MKTNLFTWLWAAVFFGTPLQAKEIKATSPDKRLEVCISVDADVSVQAYLDGKRLFAIRDLHLDTDRGTIPERHPVVRSVKTTAVSRTVRPEIKEKNGEIPEAYTETTVCFRESRLQFRVYNEGVAYRFVTELPDTLTVHNEQARFVFDDAAQFTYQHDDRMHSDYEAPYVTRALAGLPSGSMGNLPALVQTPAGKVIFLEADVDDYPCMWLKKEGDALVTHFWPYPKAYTPEGNPKNRRRVSACEAYIARTEGTRAFPWRILGTAREDTDLLNNQLVYLLGPACRIADPSWIEPGWVTLDWWSRRGLYGVDFQAGVNTETARYMIDFAAAFGIRYFLLDDGWTLGEDLTRSIDALDMEAVAAYAASKGVGLMLWVTYDLFDSQMEAALQQFARWGVKGIKVDFINRSDQEAVKFYRRAAEAAARYRMVLDFHGAYKPDGLRRAYPNILTREALIEFEYSGGTSLDNPDHHCTLPFIRNVAGPMDYIPGTLNNGTKGSFKPDHNRPMGQGTRAHSMAMAVIAESPMQMLPDAQSDYYREEVCTRFLAAIPTEWDRTVPLNGRIGDYLSVARRRGNTWYAASITDWTPRTLTLAFDFLDEGRTYTAEIFHDGPNAGIRAIDYKRTVCRVSKGDTLTVSLASGGGWVARIF